MSNLFKRETLSGEFLQINTYLVRDLQERGLWTDEIRDAIKRAEGSVQGIDAVPADLKALYRTAWELPMRSLIDMAADRGAFIDQSQSLNLFMESPTIGKLSSMYLHAWKQGSRPPTTCARARRRASPRRPTGRRRPAPTHAAGCRRGLADVEASRARRRASRQPTTERAIGLLARRTPSRARRAH